MSQPSTARMWGPRIAIAVAAIMTLTILLLGAHDLSPDYLWKTWLNTGYEIFHTMPLLLLAVISLVFKRNRWLAVVAICIVTLHLAVLAYQIAAGAGYAPRLPWVQPEFLSLIWSKSGELCIYTLLFLGIPLRSGWYWVQIGATVVGACYLINMFLLMSRYNGGPAYPFPIDFAAWLDRITLLLACAGAGLTGFGIIFYRRRVAGSVDGQPRPIRMDCPQCGLGQVLHTGRNVCGGCRQVIHIDMEDWRCQKCGYLLTYGKSSVCPECGTVVPAIPAAARDGTASIHATESPQPAGQSPPV
jgi:hypothetical protein